MFVDGLQRPDSIGWRNPARHARVAGVARLDERTMAIRRCVPGDEGALSLVGQASFLEAFAGVLDGGDVVAHCTKQHSVENYRAWLSDPRTSIWIAEVARCPVGYLVLTTPDLPLPDVGPSDLEVKRVYLLHRFQREGVGARLMEKARTHAQNLGMKRLLLGVYAENKRAIAFYERLGYVVVGARDFRVGEHTYHDLVLSLPLRG